MKRILSVLIAICLVFAMAVPALGATRGMVGDLTWNIKQGTLTISGEGEMAIEKGATAPWFMPLDTRLDIKSIVVEQGVTTIGYGAFQLCSNASSVSIAEGVTSIGTAAFYLCSGLTELVIPYGVTSIGEAAFLGCSNMQKLTIPETVTKIGSQALNECYGLTDIFYGGTEEQWDALKKPSIGKNVVVHFAKGTPVEPETPVVPEVPVEPETPTEPEMPETPEEPGVAKQKSQTVGIDGNPVIFPTYAKVDENGNDTNYVKLRDVAYLLNGTEAQFAVEWSQKEKTINLVTGKAYTSNGTEMEVPFSGDREYDPGSAPLYINGEKVELDAFVLLDDSGAGYTYFKLRDLGKALGFNVGWSKGRGIFVETDKEYTDAN